MRHWLQSRTTDRRRKETLVPPSSPALFAHSVSLCAKIPKKAEGFAEYIAENDYLCHRNHKKQYERETG